LVSKRLTPRAAAKRDHILETARRLFLHRGYAGTSMDAVTAEAGVSKQTVYSYYTNKDHLLSDVLRRVIQQLTEEKLPQLTENPPPRDRNELQIILLQLAETISGNLMNPDYLALVRIILSELARFPELGNLFRESVPKRVLNTIAAVLQQSRQSGVVKLSDDELEMAARMFVGPILTYVLLDGLMVADGPPRPPGKDTLEHFVRMYIRSVTLEV
jgi:TetR/AcrR family transcriptional repressor of mexJK operon